MKVELSKTQGRWQRDPLALIVEVLVNPDKGKPFELSIAQQRFLRRALMLAANS
jgi:hypothetical protein